MSTQIFLIKNSSFAVCVGYDLYDLEVSEKFIGFYEIPGTESSTIVTVMEDILLRYQLNLDMCRGQCYGGASNMLGKSSGVAAQIFGQQPKAHYTHCHAHSLLLLVKDVTKNTKILQDTMGLNPLLALLLEHVVFFICFSFC